MKELTSHVYLIILYISNGLLSLSYVLWENLTPIATGIAFVVLGWRTASAAGLDRRGRGDWLSLPPPLPRRRCRCCWR